MQIGVVMGPAALLASRGLARGQAGMFNAGLLRHWTAFPVPGAVPSGAFLSGREFA